ncbi:glucosidase [Pelobium manganitolerans]|uniref:Glucosidase n=1 Tax=Pelobium manganitolerans TaxID=1842495 RepID=A0A419S1U6_9SPHI|nr:glucosidase [Pelobium manganitolerans]RKD12464.1 glucosidase [Pelobium manganitolerans]
MRESAKLKKPQPWRKWGPYLSERQWGTVREDYSANGDAWDYISHDMARSKAYRWGEDGIGGISDEQQILCLATAYWNGKDPIIKERLFGLTNPEGNHGEDVKELYYYLDNVPSHSYMKFLYKYPQNQFPYQQLLEENRKRGKSDAEYELLDTGIFDNNQYFDVFTEYSKKSPTDILVRYTIHNRADKDAELHFLPTLWFRNIPSWNKDKPSITPLSANTLLAHSTEIGNYYLYLEEETPFLFTENETNYQRLYGVKNRSKYCKDGINQFLAEGDTRAVNPQHTGTKVALHYHKTIPAKSSISIKLRLLQKKNNKAFEDFDAFFNAQLALADDFYATKQKGKTDDEKLVQRQAWAGMLWSKQYYYYYVKDWLDGDKGEPKPPLSHQNGRNQDWTHLMASDIISMPDNWEYPWFAAWDTAFHSVVLASIDFDFAKQQLLLFASERYMHPNGQFPAYEWNFGDVNPPVQSWATWKIYQMQKNSEGKGDLDFLERMYHKMLLNFTWWVNRKDTEGNNIFEGGFLGLDNIGVFDRSKPLPGGGTLEQSDGTSWMAMYALNMMRIAMELSFYKQIYEDLAIKFSEHFFYIAGAMANMNKTEGAGLWDEEDGFYYDMLHSGDGSWKRLKLRTLVGLLPLIAVEVIAEKNWVKLPALVHHIKWFTKQRPDLAALVSNWEGKNSEGNLQLLSLLRGHRMKCLLRRMLDENEFLSDYGVRSVSKIYEKNPFVFEFRNQVFEVKYTPAESDTGMFGGNSNWRGPIWVPVNYLLIESMYRFHDYYGDDFKIEMPHGSGNYTTIKQAADLLGKRLTSIFLRDKNGNRPVYGNNQKLQTDPHFKDYILFHEYFNGDNGTGLGASHQTGWTGLVALLM